uniref:Rab-GAP TBC domain-containing protein n=1 Tax=Heligmosomoides polygyrus TaxID=6339 RepID=A0A183F379_HELPZ
LRTYAWRHTIASVHRVQMYKYLLGISGAYPETREIVEQHRRDEAMVLLRCLITTRSTDYQLVDGHVTEPEPSDDDVLKMILLANNRLNDAFVRDMQAMIISAIVKQVRSVCRCDWVDTFCIARSLYSMLNEKFDERTVRSTIKEVHQEVHLSDAARDDSEKFWASFDVEIWLRTGCCALLRSERAMQRWAGHEALIVDYLQTAESRFGKGFKDAGVAMTEDGELRMVNRAIETVVFETMQKKPGRISELRIRTTIS